MSDVSQGNGGADDLDPTAPDAQSAEEQEVVDAEVVDNEVDPDGPPADGNDTSYEDELLGDTDAALAASRLEDLRGLQAEYMNYKRRVDRDRARDRQLATSAVVESMIPVLDDIYSARQHGDLTEGPFAAIADKLEATLGKFGVERFGEQGETFDPALHEALMHLPEADLPEGTTETTIVQVMQPGFKVGERIVRAARVAVADPS
ncbi:nucleotide exchange factor GrpE [Ornithinimicrobium sp. INDO-MA30-4]|uniref:nucleotide exchange factor GrpE n=1 Tax=Ornithinimicrobium sp. INDO-MA30-4 TaxID=2908651 RepID=UPI001F3291A6|nr:nucleotide exchange factor GrpE [Ornithinimicrobium sp. INDO-MA30-4]UJH70386.1 nucleotide exchange factor GrpE [Ornithinimicrobium sp. INDO-MA30-4]